MRLLYFRRFGLLFACLLIAARFEAQRLNEFLASNQSVYADPSANFDDWVEIYNPGDEAIDLSGYFISDKAGLPFKWRIPAGFSEETTIQPGGFLLLWLDDQPEEGPLHLPFKLDAAGENLLLSDPDSILLDEVHFGQQTTDVSLARQPDGSGAWLICTSPTPGFSNSLSTGTPLTEIPVASVSGGRFDEAFQVVFSCSTPGAEIRLRFDGAMPDQNDSLYTQPLDIQQTTIVRARAFAPGYLPGRTASYSYLFVAPHTFPIVSLVFEPGDFFDPETGIYAQAIALSNVEVPAHATWIEPDGHTGFTADVAVEPFGSGSLTLPQKSLLLKAKPAFGSQEIEYPVFPDLPQEKYKSLVLRNSGQDWGVTMFRDAFVGSLATDISDVQPVLDTVSLAFQGFQPSVVYLNGEYWGIHNVREQHNKNFISRHFDVDGDDVDFIEFYSNALEGDSLQWQAFWQWLSDNHFQNDEKFKELADKNDMVNFTDYCIFQIVSDNVDWPGKNWRRFKSHDPEARWQWLPYDFDLSFGIMNTDFSWNTGYAGQNAFARALDSTFSFWATAEWQTVVLRRAMENQQYRHYFLNRTADLLNTVFEKYRLLIRLDAFENRYLPEIDRHFERWFASPGWLSYWQNNVQKMRDFAYSRANQCYQHVPQTFPEAEGVATINLNVEPPGAGALHFSTLHFDSAQLPWQGRYFKGIPVPAIAVAKEGWTFAGWSVQGVGLSDSISVLINGDLDLTAHFVLDSLPLDTESAVTFFQLFPNPAGRMVQISAHTPVRQVILYDALGIRRRAYSFDEGGSTIAPLDLEGLPAGVYAAEVVSISGRRSVQRFVKS
ncbi:MAG TPA: CotH kinase family protein [Saprospiraceae bacterium]|nr:CotH kinase family protein [Saprospiraceae bacterium]HPI08357.1 CotH kinase family protein [Saprospiraceae bacterium]